MLLNRHSVDGRVRQSGLQRRPKLAVIEGDVQAVLGAEIQEPPPNGILTNDVRVAQWALRNSIDDQLPAAAVVVRLVDPRIAIVLLMRVDDEVGGCRIVARWLDVADRAP